MTNQTQTSIQDPRSLAEWITFGIALVILLTLVSLIFYDWLVSKDVPPVLKVELVDPVRVVDDQYYVPYKVINSGGKAAEAIQVIAELQIDTEQSETGEQHIESLSAGEGQQGSFIFTHEPDPDSLVLRIASFSEPKE